MTTQEAIDLMKSMLSDNSEIYSTKEIGALEIVIMAAEKSNKYRKKAKRFKRKWLGLRDDITISVSIVTDKISELINDSKDGKIDGDKIMSLIDINFMDCVDKHYLNECNKCWDELRERLREEYGEEYK